MFLPDLSPLTNKIEQFTAQQQASQQQIIALLKTLSHQLSQIEQLLKKKCLE